MSDQRHYAPIIIRSSVPTPKERKFLASLIAAERKGRPITAGDLMRFFVVGGQPSFFGPVTLRAPMGFRKVTDALEKARMARFEHGESGAR